MSCQLQEDAALRWYEVWMRALRPSVSTYQDILKRQNNISFKVAALWIAISSFLAAIISFLARGFGPSEAFFATPDTALVGFLVSFFSYGIRWLFLVCYSYLIADPLGGSKQLGEQAYLFAAFFAPLGLIAPIVALYARIGSILLGLSETPTYLAVFAWLPFGVYEVVLSVIAVEAVNQFGWVKSLVSALPVIVSNVLFLLLALGVWG